MTAAAAATPLIVMRFCGKIRRTNHRPRTNTEPEPLLVAHAEKVGVTSGKSEIIYSYTTRSVATVRFEHLRLGCDDDVQNKVGA